MPSLGRYGSPGTKLSESDRMELNRRIKKYEDHPETASRLEDVIAEIVEELGEKLYT